MHLLCKVVQEQLRPETRFRHTNALRKASPTSSFSTSFCGKRSSWRLASTEQPRAQEILRLFAQGNVTLNPQLYS